MNTDKKDISVDSTRPELSDIAYELGYYLLPYYAFQRFEQVEEMCSSSLKRAGIFFYLIACKRRSTKPLKEEAALFRWHVGVLKPGLRYWALEYAPALPVDHEGVSLAERMRSGESVPLAPHFSAIIRDSASSHVSYFVLGQSPEPGKTTVRSVLPNRQNLNLGLGPKPLLGAFLDAIVERGGYAG